MGLQRIIEYENEDSSFKKDSPKKGRRKSIQFADAVEMHDHLALDQYTRKERAMCWFTPIEVDKMSEERYRTVLMLDMLGSGKRQSADSVARGLEYETLVGNEEKERRRIQCIDSVMDEQEDQWDLELFSWRRFSIVSRKASRDSKVIASMLAKEDELAALAVYCEEYQKSKVFIPSQARGTLREIRRSLTDLNSDIVVNIKADDKKTLENARWL